MTKDDKIFRTIEPLIDLEGVGGKETSAWRGDDILLAYSSIILTHELVSME
jgi:hypothetical protein